MPTPTKASGYFVPWERFNALVGELRDASDKRHTDNIERFVKIDEKMARLQTVMDEHIETDARAFADVHQAIEKNTQETRRGVIAAEETKASVEGLIAIYKAGQGMWRFGKGLRAVLLVLFGIGAGFTGTYLTLMYWLGRGPLPPLH